MKKRSSNQIKNFIVVFVAILMIVLIGLIVFLLNVDIKENTNNQEKVEENLLESKKSEEYKSIDIVNYDMIRKDVDDIIEIKIAKEEVTLKIVNEQKFKEIYPNAIINTNGEIKVAIHENIVEDALIGKIGKKHYLLIITNKGDIGIMNIEEAVENDVFRIKNNLISFENPVVRLINAYMNHEELETVIVTLSNGKKYDLADIVE